jgi:putative peptide zinc metalloprotease protein
LLLDLAPQDSTALYEQREALKRQRWLRRLASPLAIQIPLVDPDAFLARAASSSAALFTSRTFWCWLVLVAFSALAAIDQWSALALHWEMRFLDPGNLLLLWLLYPLVKGLHEFGHGLATRVWGGEVHEMGLMLLVFTPVPYVDASASTAFPDRRQRMVVAGAGIMVELLLSAVALLIWCVSEPGLLRDACFNVMVIGGLSTLLFNGNPLLRFDGYYVLTDLLEMPNLRSRANECLGALLKRHLFNLQINASAVSGGRERAWLVSYAMLSGVYRLFIGLSIALFIAGKYFFIGSALAITVIVNQIVLPLLRIGGALWQQATQEHRRARLGWVTGGSALLALLLLFIVPFNNSTRAEGVVQLPENTELRTRSAGFVIEILRLDGDRVRVDEPLVRLANPELEVEEAVLAARARELALRFNQALSGAPVELEILRREIAANAAELLEAREQLASLEIRSPGDGFFALPRGRDLPGRFLERGDLIGHVISGASPSVRVVLAQGDVDRVRRRTREIEVRLASRITETIAAERLRDVPRASSELPSALLGSSEGGDIAVDARDREGRMATQPVFQLEVALPHRPEGLYLGRRAYVRFEHFREPVGKVWFRRFRQKLLTALGI